ncbi:TRAP transporter permease [Pararhodobacter marinus]|uniref:TRAP transporter permease n=1 Tax=Pararhodobacter marinus TaxID=2184063 RepID=UPI0035110BDC
MKRLINLLAVGLPIFVVLWVLDVPRMLGISVYTEQFLAAALAMALPLVFLIVPARTGGRRLDGLGIPAIDMILGAVGSACCLYVAVEFPRLSQMVYTPPLLGLIVAIVLGLILIEGLRRSTGWGLTGVTLGILALGLLGQYLPGTLQGRTVAPATMGYFLVWDASAIFGQAMNIVVSLVLAFIIFGNALFRTGGGAFFTDLAMSVMGRFRGGSAKIAILASSLFGTISGSVVANVVTTGSITIPMMKKGGFDAREAGAVEAVASTGGQIMPPVMGIAAFLMAEFLQVPYSEVVTAALIPALLFYGAFFFQVDLLAAKRGIRPLEPAQIPSALPVLREGWYFLLPFVVLIVALFQWGMQPEKAALLATLLVLACTLTFGFRGRRPGVRDAFEILRETGTGALDLFMIGAAAGVVIAALGYSGLSYGLSLSLVQLAGGSIVALLLLAGAASIILGMGMPTPGVYILLSTLIAPSMVELGIRPMAAHMFIMYYGMLSMITPPVAIGAFAAATLSGGSGLKTAWTSVQLGWTAFVIPFVFVFSDTLLMYGEWRWIVIDTGSAALGVGAITIGLIGFLFAPILAGMRLVLLAAGVAMILPVSLFAEAHWVNLAGLAVATLVIWMENASRLRLKVTQ